MSKKQIIRAFIIMGGMVFSFQLFATTPDPPGSRILRFRESASGLLVDTADLRRILVNSRNVSRLEKGKYEIGLSVWDSPVFLMAGMVVEPRFRDPAARRRRVMWNTAFDLVDERYLLLPSLPQFEWLLLRPQNGMPYRLLFYSKQKGQADRLVLEATGTLRRDTEILLP